MKDPSREESTSTLLATSIYIYKEQFTFTRTNAAAAHRWTLKFGSPQNITTPNSNTAFCCAIYGLYGPWGHFADVPAFIKKYEQGCHIL